MRDIRFAIRILLNDAVRVERIALRIERGDFFDHSACARGEAVAHAARDDHYLIGLPHTLDSIQCEGDFAMQDVIRLVLLLVILLGMRLPRQQHDDALAIFAIHYRDYRRAVFAEVFQTIMVRNLELRLAGHDDFAAFENLFDVADDPVNLIAAVAGLEVLRHRRRACRDRRKRVIVGVLRKFVRDDLAFRVGHGVENVFRPELFSHPYVALCKYAALQRPQGADFIFGEGAALILYSAHGERGGCRFQPAPHLPGIRRVCIELNGIGRHADMFFEHGGAEADRHFDGVVILRTLVCRIADFEAGVAVLQKPDLVKLQILVASGVLADAMHHGERPLAVAEVAHHFVDVFRRYAADRADDGQARFADAFDERPIGPVTARDLDEVIAVLFDAFHRNLIPRGADGEHAALIDAVLDAAVILPAQAGF